MAKCPSCGDEDAYIGFNKVECERSLCEYYPGGFFKYLERNFSLIKKGNRLVLRDLSNPNDGPWEVSLNSSLTFTFKENGKAIDLEFDIVDD